MRCFDAAIAVIISMIALWLMPNVMVDGDDYLLLIVIGSLLLPAVGELLGLYQPWRGRSLYTMLGVYSLSWMATIALISLLLVATHTTQSFARLWMGTAALCVLSAGMATRSALYVYLRRLRARGANIKRVLLIGHSSNIKRLENRLQEMSYAGYKIKEAFVDDNSDNFIESIAALTARCAFKRDFDEIWLSYPLSDGEKIRRLSANLIGIPVSVRYFPDLTDIRLLNHRMAQVVGLYSLELNYSPLDSTPLRLVKTVEDRILGLLIFVAFIPVMLLMAGLIKWKMGGPVLFKQYRHGIDGKRFRIYKVRTMSIHHAKHTQQACYGDPRITPLGAFLRRTSLDELPQAI
ncbi:sugar transferase [Vreelandella lionensis]|uniref:sugar transferase n=1 Tax=Vreelandella lionensis TaxID=1144478 RepID=UPI001FB3D42F|nr:sugar transferase [Halomonas lionensis]